MKRVNDSLPVAQESFPFLVVTVGVAVAFGLGGLWQGSVVTLLMAAYVLFFFRNPERVPPNGTEQVACPADGKVIFVGEAAENEFLGGEKRLKISIFMSLFDVHINRAPFDGTVREMRYHPGRFLAAFDDRACEENERNCLLLETAQGETCVVVQIAGLVARRIVCYAEKGDFLMKGQRFGLIQFGSRVDIYLPPSGEALVKVGDRVFGAETLLAKMGQGDRGA